ncbi:MAG: hypothetical protein KDA77_10645, partial [Planctomycetaceae bacterium]|nr:hypothetical protein [Planctomycetaceae bacterium]
SRIHMTQLKIALSLLLVISLTVGCGRPASQQASQSSKSKNPEEAALVTVAGIYSAHSLWKKKAPEGWSDLENYVSTIASSSRTEVLDAINKIRSLNYKMKWGVDFSSIFKEDKKPDSYVIGESPDGRLKVTYSGKIIKGEANEAKDEEKPAPVATDPEEKKEK